MELLVHLVESSTLVGIRFQLHLMKRSDPDSVAIGEKRAEQMSQPSIQPNGEILLAGAAEAESRSIMDLLPDDLLAEVLLRLPPCGLAAARCVRKSWRAIIDTRRLMDLAPLPLAGFFVHFNDHAFSEFFARPSTKQVSGKLDYLPRIYSSTCPAYTIEDHCNGLLLVDDDYVVNPATRRWAALPSPRPLSRFPRAFGEHDYIAFDPTMSPHYEVLIIPHPPSLFTLFMMEWQKHRVDDKVREQEWPPSLFMLDVFSSRINKWEERSFVRQGEAMGTVADLILPWQDDERYAVYWRGQLYVHHHFLMRISLSSGKYQVIKLPQGTSNTINSPGLRLGKSEKGVYLASLSSPGRLQVWILNESCGHIEWVLKHQANLKDILSHRSYDQEAHGSWIMEDINYHFYHSTLFANENKQAPQKGKFEWDSDNDDVLEIKDKGKEPFYTSIWVSILGFHPHKEVIFLCDSLKRGLAYHLNTSKFQDLGNMYPTHYDWFAGPHQFREHSFLYTPCWTGEFPDNNKIKRSSQIPDLELSATMAHSNQEKTCDATLSL